MIIEDIKIRKKNYIVMLWGGIKSWKLYVLLLMYVGKKYMYFSIKFKMSIIRKVGIGIMKYSGIVNEVSSII